MRRPGRWRATEQRARRSGAVPAGSATSDLDVAQATGVVVAVLNAFRVPLARGDLDLASATKLALDFLLHGLAAAPAPGGRRPGNRRT